LKNYKLINNMMIIKKKVKKYLNKIVHYSIVNNQKNYF
jgi:hypothetical protein